MVIDRTISWAYDHLLEMTGYTHAEIIGQSSRLLYPDAVEFERVGREKYDQIAQKGTGSVETKWKTRSGKLIDVFLSSTPLDLEDLRKGVTFTAMDISDRKNSEKALQESEELFRFAFFTSPDAIALNRLSDGIYLDINMGFTRLLGYTREEVVGISSISLNIWKNLDQRSLLVKSLAEKKYIENLEADFVGKHGQIKVALMSASIMQIAGEDVILSVTRDITERKRIENELAEYRVHLEDLVKTRTAELEAKNKELEVFTYSVSHDLKAPLRGIDGYSRLLVEDYADKLDEEGLLFLNNVRQSATQMNQLIEDLLAYSRMERRDIQMVPIALAPVVNLLLSQRAHDLEARRIQTSVTFPFQTIHSDSETVRQVLSNYLDNAIKFLNRQIPGVVNVGGTEDKNSWILWVQDNGIGFDPQYQDRIFDIFQRLHRTEEYPGTGIGLAIVRKAVERINGRVWVETAMGKGSTFYVSIPKPQKSI
jgi:PAS domain S-box-containing protein